MRILVDIRHLGQKEPSGVGQYTIELLRALFEIDQENEYVLFSSGRVKPPCHPEESSTKDLLSEEILPPPGRGQDDKIKFLHLETPNKLLNLRTLLLKNPTIDRHVRERIDLIWLPNLNITALPADIPTVITLHDLSWNHFPEFFSHKMRLWHKATRPHELVKQATSIIVPSQATAEDVARVFDKSSSQIHTIPHGVSSQFNDKMQARDHGVRSKLHLPKRFALFVGTLEPRKNLLTLVDALHDYRKAAHDDLHLVLAGKWGWRSQELRHRLRKHDARAWVHHLGYVDDLDRAALYRSAEVFTWPSLYEGFGLPVLEAMACGTPVITSLTSSLPELTQDAAVLVDPFNSHDITDALRGVIGSKPLQDQLIKKGLARAQAHSWKTAAQKTLEIFRQTTRK